MTTTPFPNPFAAPIPEKKAYIDPKELREIFNLQLECQECGYRFTEKDPFPHQCPVCHPVQTTNPEQRIMAALCDKICYLIMSWWKNFTIENPYPCVEDLKPEHLSSIVKYLEDHDIRQVTVEVAKIEKDEKTGRETMCLYGYFTDATSGTKIQIGETNLVFYSWFNKVMRWLNPIITNFSIEDKERLNIFVEESNPPTLTIYLGEEFIAVHKLPSYIPVRDLHRTLAVLAETSQHGYDNRL